MVSANDPSSDTSIPSRAEAETDRATDLEHAQASPKQGAVSDVPPDGGYGWVCVACAFWINGSTWGINSTYAIFLAYYLSHNYFPNTSALVYAFVGGLSISLAVLVAPLATACIRRFGTKVTLHIGIFFETISLIGASFATQKYQLILAQGICFGIGMGFLFVGSVGIIPQWFSKKRSVANAISAAGSGCGALIWSLSTQSMIDRLGLPWAFRILAILSFSINLVASNVIRDRNSQVGARHRSFDLDILKRPEFVLLQAWSWFSMLGYVIVLFSLPAYAKAIGLSAQQGSIVAAMLNLGQMCGRPFIGLASDRYGRLNLAMLFTLLCGVFCFVFWIPTEVAPSQLGLLIFFAVVGGALAGTFWATIAPVCAEVVGLRDLPSALSWTWLIMVPPVTCAEPIALELRRVNTKHWVYVYAQLFCGLSYIIGGFCLWIVRGWKVGEMEEQERLQSKESSHATFEKDDEIVMPPSNESPDPRDHMPGVKDDALTRQKSAASIREAGWRPRDLLRRMMKITIV